MSDGGPTPIRDAHWLTPGRDGPTRRQLNAFLDEIVAPLERELHALRSSERALFSDDQRKALNNLAERLRNAMLFIEEWANWWAYGLGLDDSKPLTAEETAAAEKMADSIGARARDMVIDNRRALANVPSLALSATLAQLLPPEPPREVVTASMEGSYLDRQEEAAIYRVYRATREYLLSSEGIAKP
jgi:hypothetical protein